MAVLSPHDQLWRWKLINGGGTVITGPSAPNANDGGLWFEDTTATLWVRYNDGNSTQWVAAAGPPGPASTVPGPPGTNGTNGTNGATGPAGPTGPAGNGTWTQMTQAAYNALTPKDPNILYVIIG